MSVDSSKPPIKNWSWSAALGVSLLSLIGAQVITGLVAVAVGWDIQQLSNLQTYSLAILAVALPPLGIVAYLSRRQHPIARLGLGQWPKPWIKPLIRALGWYVLTATVALGLLTAFVPSLDLNQTQDLGLGGLPQGVWEYLSLFLLLVILTPLGEEILFRGFLLRGIAGRVGWSRAAVITSLLFGLAHWQLNVAIDTAILGWYSAQLVIQTGSLWPSLLLHSLKNLLAFSLVFIAPLL